MLVEFTVENYRSFRDKATFSLLASSDKSLQNNVSDSIAIRNEKLVNSAVIYGPNASGKSNIIMAMAQLRNFVTNSHTHQKGTKLNHQPFAFDPEKQERPTIFTISFIHEDILYDYLLSFNKDRIVQESLFHYPNGKRATIFVRDLDSYEFTKDQKEQEVISKRTLENALYLSTSVQFNYKGTLPAFEWFFNNLTVIVGIEQDQLVEMMIENMNKDKKFKKMALQALKIADLGIVGAEGKVQKIPIKDLHGKIPPQLIGIMSLAGGESMKSTNLMFKHTIKDERGIEQTYALDYRNESEGTRRLFAIIGPIIDSLTNGGSLFIDELDTKIHHQLSEWMIGLFHDPEQNKKGAQLIFNTHDLLLLDQDLFRRDQIWFTEKNMDSGSSALYSLAEFSERKDKDILKGYLIGRYGSTPYIGASKVV